LRQLIWDKLEKQIGDAKTVLISPSGELARFPWAALPGKEPGKYLLEERAIAVIPVPQQLPALLAERPTETVDPSLLLVGDVDYGALPGTALLASASHSAPRLDRAGELTHWQPLSGSRSEIAAINDSFARGFHNGKVDTLDGLKPTEEAVRQQAGQHRYVHLATHGFFTPPEVKSALDESAGDNRRREFNSFSLRDVSGLNPGLLSGVVLAGANRPPAPDQDDGILTALEVAELDLSHVELVTLSACETGLGKSAGGEGLLGLQRAFQVAGARNVVASLWKVDDAATQALMSEFYKNLWQKKLSPLESLRQAQLMMIAHYQPTSEKLRAGFDAKPIDEKALAEARRNLKSGEQLLPPLYWAAFVLSGPGD
jgi:CHAT domain-containing protein